MTPSRRLLVLFLVTGIAIIGVALGSANRPANASPFMGTSDPNEPYDLRFIDEMVMHHEGAIMSARVMIDNSQHPELRDLAGRIEQGQQQQIDQMLRFRQQWYPDAPARRIGMGSMMGGGIPGMMSDVTGSVDRMFLRMMIPHRQLAVAMSQDALKHAQHEELQDLARSIMQVQSAEITEMKGYLKAWYSDSSTRGATASIRGMMGR